MCKLDHRQMSPQQHRLHSKHQIEFMVLDVKNVYYGTPMERY